MKGYREMTKEELIQARGELIERYEKCKALNLTLDMTRGKPSPVQLDLSNDIYDTLKDGFKTAKNEDTRNPRCCRPRRSGTAGDRLGSVWRR